jgi:hypothetical protein
VCVCVCVCVCEEEREREREAAITPHLKGTGVYVFCGQVSQFTTKSYLILVVPDLLLTRDTDARCAQGVLPEKYTAHFSVAGDLPDISPLSSVVWGNFVTSQVCTIYVLILCPHYAHCTCTQT